MSPHRILLYTATILLLLTPPVSAQHAGHGAAPAVSIAPAAPLSPVQPAAAPATSPAAGIVDFGPPVEDQMIVAHGILDQFETRLGGGGRPEFRWDGQAWIGTDTDKLWLKSEGLLRKDGSLDDGRHQFL